MYIFQFWVQPLRFFLFVFPEASALCEEKIFEVVFTALYFYLCELKKCVLEFQNLISNWEYWYFCSSWCLFQLICSTKKLFFFCLGFLSRTLTNHRAAGEGGEHFFNSSLPLPAASRTLRYQPGDCCRELASAHNQQPDSNRETLVSERKSLTSKLRALSRVEKLSRFNVEKY